MFNSSLFLSGDIPSMPSRGGKFCALFFCPEAWARDSICYGSGMNVRLGIVTVAVALVGLSFSACDKDSSAEASPPAAKAEEAKAEAAEPVSAKAPAAEAKAEAEGTEAKADTKKVVVAEDGTEFDPPVEKSQIPDGAWICDMGTVHYARMKKGDGKCAKCGMNLVEHKH